GASAGGPTTLAHVFELLKTHLKGVKPGQLLASMLVVQHMPAAFTAPMAARFAELSGLPVRVAETGDTLEKGSCLVAPGGRNLFLNDSRKIQLSGGGHTPGEYPKIDLALVTAADLFGSHLCGIILTGMGRDGTEGLTHAYKLRAATFVQEPSTCVVDGMPTAALQAKAAEVRLTPAQIAEVVAHILLHARVPSLEGLAKHRIDESSGDRRAVDSDSSQSP
ncbi:MAG TPA: CheB methylesterase domain-containing protein, partial [Planctomycetota bacterium]|nr:CheB methylesterase domain-containing protein [Planctomycetota bacterium]